MLKDQPQVSFNRMHNMLMQSLSAKAILAAVELKVCDYLEDAPASAAVLAVKTGLVEARLEPVLDILVAAGVMMKEKGEYMNSTLAREYFVSISPLYQGKSMMLNMRFIQAVENDIVDFLSGKEDDRNQTDNKWGADEVMEGSAQYALGTGVGPVLDVVTSLPGFSDFRTMCDIGGNHGVFTMGVLGYNPTMLGTIIDLPSVAEQAQKRCDKLGYEGRITAVGLDVRTDTLPAEAFDLTLMSHILYVFKDDLSGAIARIADCLRPGGWLVSHHYAGKDLAEDRMATASLELLTRLCGYSSHFIEREELEAAFTNAGFVDIQFQPASSDGFGLITSARKEG